MPSQTLTFDEKTSLRTSLTTGLSRRRWLHPWPLTCDETPLLWWHEEQYKQLLSLRAAGGFDHAFERFSSAHVVVNDASSITVEGRDMPVFGTAARSNTHLVAVTLLNPITAEPSLIHEKFFRWHEAALITHKWNLRVIEMFREISSKASTWGQLRKAIPTMFDLVADMVRDHPALERMYSSKSTRATELAAQFKGVNMGGYRFIKLDTEEEQIKFDRHYPVALAVMRQALEQPVNSVGKLDISEFKKTWFR